MSSEAWGRTETFLEIVKRLKALSGGVECSLIASYVLESHSEYPRIADNPVMGHSTKPKRWSGGGTRGHFF